MADPNAQSDVTSETYHKVSDVAKLFDVENSTVRTWLKDGTLLGIKIGKGHYWRIPASSVNDLAQKRYGEKR